MLIETNAYHLFLSHPNGAENNITGIEKINLPHFLTLPDLSADEEEKEIISFPFPSSKFLLLHKRPK